MLLSVLVDGYNPISRAFPIRFTLRAIDAFLSGPVRRVVTQAMLLRWPWGRGIECGCRPTVCLVRPRGSGPKGLFMGRLNLDRLMTFADGSFLTMKMNS